MDEQEQRQSHAALGSAQGRKETIMLLAPLPLDYIQHLDRGDRIRRSRNRPSDDRVRRGMPGGTGE